MQRKGCGHVTVLAPQQRQLGKAALVPWKNHLAGYPTQQPVIGPSVHRANFGGTRKSSEATPGLHTMPGILVSRMHSYSDAAGQCLLPPLPSENRKQDLKALKTLEITWLTLESHNDILVGSHFSLLSSVGHQEQLNLFCNTVLGILFIF